MRVMSEHFCAEDISNLGFTNGEEEFAGELYKSGSEDWLFELSELLVDIMRIL